MNVIARRYARAAVEAADERAGARGVDALTAAVAGFLGVFSAHDELRRVLLNPALKAEHSSVIDAVAQKLDIVDEARSLLRLLADANRLDMLEEVAEAVQTVADERAGRVRAHVVSAVELNEAQQKRLAKALEGRFGQPVTVSAEVDASLLAGLVCQVGDVTLDASLRRQLELLRERLDAPSQGG